MHTLNLKNFQYCILSSVFKVFKVQIQRHQIVDSEKRNIKQRVDFVS